MYKHRKHDLTTSITI